MQMPSIWEKLCPEFAEWFGVPLRLKKSCYGRSCAGKDWTDTLFDYLTNELSFKPVEGDPALFVFTHPKKPSRQLYVCNYVNDMLYFGTDDSIERWFEQKMKNRFNIDFQGQVHWFLQAGITQDSNYNIHMDQHRYSMAIVRRYLPSAPTEPSERDRTVFAAPLPSNVVFSKTDKSQSEDEVEKLASKWGFEYASAIGSLIYLLNTAPMLMFSIRKLAKFMHLPGEPHF